MPTQDTLKLGTKRKNLYLRAVKGHFATSSAHSNYYIDVAAQKSRLTEAQAVADELSAYYHTTVVDTILCLDGTEVIGTCLADKLTRGSYVSMNAHQTIYIVTPEMLNGQLLFRDNIVPMIQGKHVLVLAVSVASGNTVKSALEAVRYYGGQPTGIAAIFATKDKIGEIAVHSAFDPNDIDGYGSYAPHECPLCKQGAKIDALINCYGFSKL
ncbi:MAG: orotate phosphoribosyltransferase [Clostridia bacterium]|nr:orotate phosphoribosyltransferase [Clostridia bacterium]